MEEKKVEEKKVEEKNQISIEGVVVGHELVENGTRLIIVVPPMESVPRNVKFVW